MKLINRFIRLYILVSVVVLAAGGVIAYNMIKREFDRELFIQFRERIERVEFLLADGDDFGLDRNRRGERIEFRNLIIEELDNPVEERVVVSDTMAWHPQLRRMEESMKVSSYREIGGNYYVISTYGPVVDSDDIITGVFKSLLWILALQVIGALGVGFLVSGRLFRPFRETLEKIKDFKLNRREPIKAEDTKVLEFNELNRFVEEMTTKAISDYENLKEFAENASHELQTPLSIAKGKLELLTESNMSPDQYKYVESAQNAIRKLSRLSGSLGLLTKIENHEFEADEEVDLTHMITESLRAFEELIALNGLKVTSNLEENVKVRMHPVLADILWTNLLQNAIRHNIKEGTIDILLDRNRLRISNTGETLTIDPEELFQRFKKSDQSTGSIGLGLSIVKRIINQSGFDITYSYADGIHTIEVYFSGDNGRD